MTSEIKSTGEFAITAPAAKPFGWLSATTMLLAGLQTTTAAQSPAGARAPGVSIAGQFVHESWTVESGLPVNSIRRVLQSRDGYIWIATLDGLIRFDGVRFTVYSAANSPELPNNRFIDLHESRDGSLWLQTEQWQLFRFRNGRFTRYGPDRGLDAEQYELHQGTTGVLWVSTAAGLGRIDGERFVLTYPAVRGPIRGLVQRRDGSLWVTTESPGVLRIEAGRLERVGSGMGLDTAIVWSMSEDPEGRLWLGTNSGVWMENGTLQQVASGAELRQVHSFVFPAGSRVLAVSARGVYRIEDRGPVRVPLLPGANQALSVGDTVWYSYGTRLYTEDGPAWDLSGGSPRQNEDRQITALTVDREGSFWLGTANAGLHRLKPALFRTYSEPEGLVHRNAATVGEDSAGAIWVGTRGGLSRIAENGQVTSFTRLPSPAADVFTLHFDRADHAWVGTGAALLSCMLPEVECHRDDSPAVRNRHITALYRDSRGRLWAGAGPGAVLEDGRWSALADRPGSAQLRAFAESRDGAIWIATNGEGLLRYDGRFARIDGSVGLPNDFVRALHVDTDGWLWVGTEGGGIARLDPRAWHPQADSAGRRITRIGVEQGLYDAGIHQILEDNAGRIWMSSNRGIFWVARAELMAVAEGRATHLHSTQYTERDGMRNREANGGSQPAGIRARDGRLWFPTQDGVVVIDPDRVTAMRGPPQVVIERVNAAERTHVPTGEPLRLGADERDVAVEYTAPSFVEPENLRFRYRLQPYDADWVDVGNRRTAFYTRLPPGRYTFRAAASSDGITWSDASTPVELTLTPLFHETTAAKLLLLLALGILVSGGFQWRVRQLRVRARELTQVVEQRTAALRQNEQQLAGQNVQLAAQASRLAELDQAKSRFFANVSHEFRTPLTLTIGPLEDAQAQLPEHEPARQSLDMALRNARRLLRLVNQILDVARLEAAQMKLRPRPLDLATFTRGVASAFAPLAESRDIRLSVDAPASVTGHFDPDALEKILANLLSNALKFTPSGGQVTVRLTSANGTVELRVDDNGPGIAPEHLPHVFERFYQVDETNVRAHPGTGIGLALVHELAKLHGGTVAVASDGAHAGASFTVRLPLHVQALPESQSVEDDPGIAFRGPDDFDAAAGAPEIVTVSGEDVTTVLVVDDSADLRAYLRDHLGRRFRVLEADGGAVASEIVRTELPDIVVSDVMMPDVDGHELVRRLRASPETDYIPIILLTAQATPEHRIAGLERGADDYIAKPFDMRELGVRIDNLIASRRRLRERFAQATVALPAGPLEVHPHDREFLERVRDAIAGNLENPDFGVAELANAVFQDRSHLYRRVRELLGKSPSDLLRRARLERAAELLASDAGTVADIAYTAGFHSVSYFTRAFQLEYGATPAAWRSRRPKA